jgi:penicillin amidase
MNFLKKSLKLLGIIIVLAAIALFFFIQHLKPDYNGEKNLDGLSDQVTVYYDSYGIPHIYAETEADAYKTLGYVHAQDRLWQMELLRRIASGRLSEIFGEVSLPNDRFFLNVGIHKQTERIVSNLDKNQPYYKLTEAYLEGVNSFIEQGPTPIEYYILGLEKTPFTIEDVFNTIGYMSFSFVMAQKTDPIVSSIKTKYGAEYIEDLFLDYPESATHIKNYSKSSEDYAAISNHVNQLFNQVGIPVFNGSNSWVLSGQKTKSNQVLFANDPHIAYSQPAVWFEAHISTPSYERYGYHIGGVPFPLLSHGKDYATGLTMFENDDADFYKEELNPENKLQYKTNTGWEDLKTREETVYVKGSDPITFTVYETHHGPIINNVVPSIETQSPVSLYWIYTALDRNMIETTYHMNYSKDINDFESHLPALHAPGLNVMYGDAQGNIGWWASAQLYERLDSNHPKMIKEGVFDKDSHLKMLPFSQNPKAVNPDWGYVYSANNATKTIDGIKIPGYYAPENRAKRIVELLDQKNDWTLEDFKQMIVDDTSAVLPDQIQALIPSVNRSELSESMIQSLEDLSTWKGDYNKDSYNPSLFHRWEYEFLKATFEDEIGSETTMNFINSHLSKKLVTPLMKKDASVWYNNIHTETIEDKSTIVTQSFKAAYESLVSDYGSNPNDWAWGKLHQLESPHALGSVKALRSFFNVGPFPISGAREVINAVNFRYTGEDYFPVNGGPSTRRIIDFSDIEHSVSVLPTGQSGNPFSKHYDDQAKLYVNGEFRQMLLNKEEIIENATGILIFNE